MKARISDGVMACSFNEAEARGLGKRQPTTPNRPPQERFNEAEARGLGKRLRRRGDDREIAASMRPRHEASENANKLGIGIKEAAASMRPRHEASENAGIETRTTASLACFNEAEARGLGKRIERPGGRPGVAASMRPRHEASENTGCRPAG